MNEKYTFKKILIKIGLITSIILITSHITNSNYNNIKNLYVITQQENINNTFSEIEQNIDDFKFKFYNKNIRIKSWIKLLIICLSLHLVILIIYFFYKFIKKINN